MAISLYELAHSSYLFSRAVDINEPWAAFQTATGSAVNLRNPDHQKALLCWLNQWGCRQFSKACHQMAAQEIAAWYDANEPFLPSVDDCLLDVGDDALADIVQAFDGLSACAASVRQDGVRQTVGPTGAAKTLFALRPKVLAPWDGPIRNHFGHDGRGASYLKYLKQIRHELFEVDAECRSHGFVIGELPRRLGMPDATLPQLVDMHYWMTITRRARFASPEQLRKWINWAQPRGPA